MTQTNEGTGSGAVNKLLPPIYNGVVKETNLSDNLLRFMLVAAQIQAIASDQEALSTFSKLTMKFGISTARTSAHKL